MSVEVDHAHQYAVSWSPDSKLVVTSSADTTVKICTTVPLASSTCVDSQL